MSDPTTQKFWVMARTVGKLVVIILLSALFFVLLGGAAQAQDRTCYEGQGVNDSHSWIFRSSADMQLLDTLRAYAPDGECIGVQAWQPGQNNALAVKGQVDVTTRLINAGDPIDFMVWRGGEAYTLDQSDFVYEDTDLGPSPSTYQINGISIVSDFTVTMPEQETITAFLDLPSEVQVLGGDQDSLLIPLDFDLPATDTLFAYQLRIQGSAEIRPLRGYLRTADSDSGRWYQVVGTEVPGGQMQGEVEDDGPQLWLPAPAPLDTLSARLLDVTVWGLDGINAEPMKRYTVQFYGDNRITWTRTLEYDLNLDAEVDMADVIVALTRATQPSSAAQNLLLALRIYWSLD